MKKIIEKLSRFLSGKKDKRDEFNDSTHLMNKTAAGTTWAMKRYRGALEKLEEYDRT